MLFCGESYIGVASTTDVKIRSGNSTVVAENFRHQRCGPMPYFQATLRVVAFVFVAAQRRCR